MTKQMINSHKILTFLSLLLIPFFANAQKSPTQRLADLEQDVAYLSKALGEANLQMEEINRQNARLQRALDASNANNAAISSQVMNIVKPLIANLKEELLAADKRNQNEIVRVVSAQINDLEGQTNSALKNISKVASTKPVTSTNVSFSNDYPTGGISYTVRSGDTLSGIASRNNSTISWIRNANKIVTPEKDLRPGQEIFIPQK